MVVRRSYDGAAYILDTDASNFGIGAGVIPGAGGGGGGVKSV